MFSTRPFPLRRPLLPERASGEFVVRDSVARWPRQSAIVAKDPFRVRHHQLVRSL